MEQQRSYVAYIDGLRALAICAILLHQIESAIIPGGYLGFDLFFIISGYLLNQAVCAGLTGGKTSLVSLYARRIRRVLPQYFLVITATVVAGIFYLLPFDFHYLVKLAQAALLFDANQFVSTRYGYFAAENGTLPLLHLWSLSVGAQLYLVFPAILFFGYRHLSKLKMISLLAIITVGSVLWCYGQYSLDPLHRDSFYGFYARAYEFSFGIILSIIPKRKGGTALSSLLLVTGITIVLLSLFVPHRPLEGSALAALSLCLGMFLIVQFSESPSSLVIKILSHQFFRMVSAFSFSLYLVHFPVLAFVRYFKPNLGFTFVQGTGCLVAIGLLAFFGRHFVEKPAQRLGWYILLLGAPLLIGANFLIQSDGLPARYGDKFQAVDKVTARLLEIHCADPTKIGDCTFGDPSRKPKTILFGDITASHFTPLLDEVGKKFGFSFVTDAVNDCPALLDLLSFLPRLGTNQKCLERNRWINRNIDLFDTYILASYWDGIDRSTLENDETLEKQIRFLKSLRKTVILFEVIPECKGVTSFYRNYYSVGKTPWQTSLSKQDIALSCGKKWANANAYFEKVAQRSGALFFRPVSEFQHETGQIPFGTAENFLYKNESHLNIPGSSEIGQWCAAFSKETFRIFKNLR